MNRIRTKGKLPAMMPTQGSIMDHMATSLAKVSHITKQPYEVTEYVHGSVEKIRVYFEQLDKRNADDHHGTGPATWLADERHSEGKRKAYVAPRARKIIIAVRLHLPIELRLSRSTQHTAMNQSLAADKALWAMAADGT